MSDPCALSRIKKQQAEMRKKLAESGSIDRLRLEFENIIRTTAVHKEYWNAISKTCNSNEKKSCEEIFRSMLEEQTNDDLDTTVKKVARQASGKLSDEEKNKIFRTFYESIRKYHELL